MNKNKILTHGFLIAAVVFGAGCANYALVDETRKSYNEVKNDPVIAEQAPNALREAGEQFDIIENLKKNGASKEFINHHAYIAKQKIAIAREMAELNSRQNEMAQLENEQQMILAEVQQAEARAAELRAEKAKEEAEEATRRSEQLAMKISELEAEKTERGIIMTLRNVLFASGSAKLKLGSEQNLTRLSRFLIEYPDRRVMIEGFTDNVGSESINQRLSLLRAEAVKQKLIEMGIGPNRILTRGYGEAYPIVSNSTEAGRQQNRRVEIVISDERGIITQRRDIQ